MIDSGFRGLNAPMNSRVVLFLGPVLALYLIADVASRGGAAEIPALRFGTWALLAMGAALAPWVARGAAVSVASRLVIFAAAASVVIVRSMAEGALSPMVSGIATAAVAVVVWSPVTFALAVPVVSRRRGVALALEVAALAASVALAGWLLSSASLGRFGFPRTVASLWTSSLVLAAVVRVVRARGEQDGARHADQLLGVLGTAAPAALACAYFVVANSSAGHQGPGDVLLPLSFFASVLSHAVLLRGAFRVTAAEQVRAFLARGAAAVAAVGLGVAFAPRGAAQAAITVAAALAVAAAVREVAELLTERLFAPFEGRLLRGLGEASHGIHSSSTLEDLARNVLRPLRVAAGDLDSEPVLFVAVPGREIRIDAAGEPRVREVGVPMALAQDLLRSPSSIWVRSAIEERIVRRPELRPVAEVLRAHDALLALPLIKNGELEGVIVLPRGTRREPLRLEEETALVTFGAELASWLSMLAALERMSARARDAEAREAAVGQSLVAAQSAAAAKEDEIAFHRRSVGGDAATLAAYSEPMRVLLEQISEAEKTSANLVLLAEGGSGVLELARLVHGRSARKDEPFAAVRATGLKRGDLEAQLFGPGGAVALAKKGTVTIDDAAAMPLEVQAAFFDAVTAVRGECRVIFIVRSPAALATMDPALLRVLSPVELSVPALRARSGDVPSLVLAAVERSARAHGRPSVGIDAEAMDALCAHAWPGNMPELELVMERAMLAASGRVADAAAGTRITRADLPILWTPEGLLAGDDPLSGTYDELEQRILERALERANGNKSEAARLLGLKRTTFLDKLRRFSPDESSTRDDEL